MIAAASQLEAIHASNVSLAAEQQVRVIAAQLLTRPRRNIIVATHITSVLVEGIESACELAAVVVSGST